MKTDTTNQIPQANAQDLQNFLQAAIDALPYVICIVDTRGIVLFVNLSWKDFFLEHNPEQKNNGIGSSYFDSFPHDEKTTENLRFMFSEELFFYETTYHYCSSALEKWFIMRCSHFSAREKDQIIISHVDITEQKRLELELLKQQKTLQELNRALNKKVHLSAAQIRQKNEIMLNQSRHAAMGEMISMIAHQWRQPITGIGMSISNMLMDIEMETIDPTRMKKNLKLIDGQVKHLSHTIDDFRNFFKDERIPVLTSLKKICDHTLKIIGKSLESSNIKVIIVPQKEEIEVETFAREVVQVLLNLLSNAQDILMEKQPKEAWIRITLSRNGEQASIEVCDNGGGISPEHLEHIFDPYFSTKPKQVSTGLGLYMCKAITQQHLHGTLKAYNQKAGACFAITLPIKIPPTS